MFVQRIESRLDRLASGLQQPSLAVVGLVLIHLALLTPVPQADPDLFARVAVGRLVELQGGVAHEDPFSFSPRLDRWVDHEWLSGVVFYQTAELGGDLGLLVLNYLFLILTIGTLVRAHREFSGRSRVGLVWLLASLTLLFGVWVSVIRCRVFSFLAVSLLILVLVRWRNGKPRWLWILPPVFLLWANLHGGFVAGLGLLGSVACAVAVKTPRKSFQLWLVLALSILATLVNPYGLEYWDYILRAVTMERAAIEEWQTPGLVSHQVIVSLVLVLTIVLGQLATKKRIPPEGWALIAAGFVATLWAQRIFYFLLVILSVYGGPSAAAVGRKLEDLGPTLWAAGRRILAVGYVLGLLVLGVGTVGRLTRVVKAGLGYEAYPVEAVGWLEQYGAGGKVLVHFNHGSFALWRLYPHFLVSIDGRYEEVYPQSTFDLNWEAFFPELPGHEAALGGLDPDYIVFNDPARVGLFGPEWYLVHSDAQFAVLSKAPPPSPSASPRPSRPMWQPGF